MNLKKVIYQADYSCLNLPIEQHQALLIEKNGNLYTLHLEDSSVYFNRVKESAESGIYEDSSDVSSECIILGHFKTNTLPSLEQIAKKLNTASALDILTLCAHNNDNAFMLEKLF